MGEAESKTRRVIDALEGREPDRVPIGEFFWTNFLRRARAEIAGGSEFDPYRHWDLDLIVVNPNLDPHITGIEVLEESPERKLVRTGFGALVERRGTYPMPHFLDFGTKTWEQIEALELDDPTDQRRYFEAIDDQINAVGDELNLGLPSFADRVQSCAEDFCVFGGITEPYEHLWRMIGTENALMKLAERPDRMNAFVERIGDFLVEAVRAQAEAAGGVLAGLYVWGDIAYDKGMLFSPEVWRTIFKPQVARICDAAHAENLKVVYHGCGDCRAVYEDLIEIGVDAYNPLEAKAGLDVVDLKRQYGGRWAFNGNIDVRVLATNDRARIRREVLGKLAAARAGGYILQSDHSVPDNVDPASYDYMIELAREYGTYPLRLEEGGASS